MDKANKKILKRFLIIAISILVVSYLYYSFKEFKTVSTILENVSTNSLTVNQESGFYSDSISIKVSRSIDLPINIRVFYTLDGNDPTTGSTKYTGKFNLPLIEGKTTVYPLKVAICYKKVCSTVINKTYIIDSNIENRYDLNVISITTDSYNLYDHYHGIFVPGERYDRELASGKEGAILGNYNSRGDEWIRKAYVTMLDTKGSILIDQNIGISVSGQTSSAYAVKSLKLISNKGYSNQKLKYDFYSGNEYAINSMASEYNAIKLRSGSQDMEYGNVRSSVFSRLANESNFDGCTKSSRAIVYINGTFFGIFDMQQDDTNSFLKDKYALDDSEKIEKHKWTEQGLFDGLGVADILKNDLDDPDNIKKLESVMDMDSYMLYYAMNIILNNNDWPNNNFEIWKYNGTYNPNNKYTDGKWRFISYDLDMMLYSYGDNPHFKPYFDKDIFEELMSENALEEKSSYFKYFMQSNYYRDKFLNTVLDLLNTTLSGESINDTIDVEFARISSEMKLQLGEDFYNRSLESINIMKEKASMRKQEMLDNFEKYFHLKSMYKVNIKNDSNIQIKMNSINLYKNQEYSNNYYKNTTLSLEAIEYPGYDFSYWIVNNQKYYEKEITVSSELAEDGEINIQIVAKKNNIYLVINEISAKSDSDWIKLTNIGNDDIFIGNYYLSDNYDKMMKYQLPDVTLKPNDSIIINGKNNYYALGDYICNFNLSATEILYLYDGSSIVDQMYVPYMDKTESYGRLYNSSTYVYFYNKNNERKK